MDAYDGSMTFYVADPTDPLIRAWEGVFPTLFKPLSSMPADLQAHLRVPEDLFNVQTETYAKYHVTDPANFYQGNDLWTVPQNQATSATGQLPLEAYYVNMRMPGAAKTEFLLLQPMVPKSRPNMIAWVAARNDAPNYGAGRGVQVPAGHVGLRAGADRGPDRPGAGDQLPAHAVEPVRQHRRAGQPDRGPGPGLDHLPRADLPAVHRLGDPRVHEDRRGQPDQGRLGRHAGAGPQPPARRLGLDGVAQPAARRPSPSPA